MGGLNSKLFSRANRVNPSSPVDTVLPIYYTRDELTEVELEASVKVWGLITSNKAASYVHLRRFNPQFGYSNCSEYFYEYFYNSLLEAHPGAKVMFKKSNKRMRQYFIGSFTMLLDSVTDTEKFNRSLVSLAHVHNNIGVKAIEYGLVGELIMSAIQKCCGDDFTVEARKGWVKLFSRMFDIILPIVVNFEMKNCGELMKDINGSRNSILTVSVTGKRCECPHSAASSIRSTASGSCPAQ